MENDKGEQAETQTLAQAAGLTQMDTGKTTLKVWDVPVLLAQKFIATSKASYANKSWLLLQDLMLKADRYDAWVTSGKIVELEARIMALEDFIADAQKEQNAEPETETKAKKKPKTFGDDHE